MSVQPSQPSEAQEALLQRFRRAGVVLDVAFFTHAPGAAPAAAARAAVTKALAQEGGKASPGAGPVGTPLQVPDWLTPSYDVVEGALRLFSYGKDYRSKSPTSDRGLPRALFDPPYSVHFPELKSGWPRTAAEQSEHEAALGELLREFLSVIVGIEDPDDVEGLLLTEWTTDWHPYFDAGHEWWGSFCWSVHRPDPRTIVVLTASSTD